MMSSETYDVIVIGAGIQGCSTAYQLARRRRRVLLLEKGTAGRQASGVNAGGVRRLGRDPAEVPLSLVSMEMWYGLEKELGFSCGFKVGGQVKIAESDAEMSELEKRADLMKSMGCSHEELIGPAELRTMVPEAAGHCVGGLVCRNDGYAEPYWATRAFLLAGLNKGVDYRERCGVTDIEKSGDSWVVRCDKMTFQAPVIVNCAGAWGGEMARLVGDHIPIKPESPTMMVTAPVKPFLEPVVGLVGRKLSFKQMPNGNLVIGGGHRSHLDFSKESTVIDFDELRISARTVSAVFPGVKNVPIVRCWAGIEGMLPDHLPAIGASTKAPGVFHACGFSAHGFQLGPVIGRIMSDLIESGRTNVPLEPLRHDRFSEGASG